MRVWDERVDREIIAKSGVTAVASTPASVAVPRHGGLDLVGLVGDLLAWSVLLLSFFILALAMLTRSGASTGTQWLVVVSGSMAPALKTGALVSVQPVPANQLQVGDIITFHDSRNPAILVTHRIVAKDALADGTMAFQVKGDANKTVDPELVQAGQVVGRVRFHLPLVGYVIHAMQARPILVLLALLPSVAVFGLQAVRRLGRAEAGVRAP